MLTYEPYFQNVHMIEIHPEFDFHSCFRNSECEQVRIINSLCVFFVTMVKQPVLDYQMPHSHLLPERTSGIFF